MQSIRFHSRQKGLTLLELIIVVAIVGIVASFAVPAYQDYIKTSRQSAAANKVEAFKMFLEAGREDNAGLPVPVPPIPGVHVPGRYEPGVVNDFTMIGYRVDGDSSDFGFRVVAGACGDIRVCYAINVYELGGADFGTYESGAWTWVP